MSFRQPGLIVLLSLAAVSGCRSGAPGAPPASSATSAIAAAASGAPPSVPADAPAARVPSGKDDRLGGVLWVQTSAEYRALALATYARARAELDRALADPSWTAALEQQGEVAALPPAVVADVDETLLDNSPYEADRIRAGLRYEEESWRVWVNRASAAAIPGAAEFVRYAAGRGVTVFYVTNRAALLEEKTRANLVALGFPVASDRDTVLMAGERPDWSSDKGTRRAEVARSFRILLLVGDDLGDFVSGARALPDERVALAERFAERWQTRWILLPNPYYGSWEKALSDNERGLSDDEILRRKVVRLRGTD